VSSDWGGRAIEKRAKGEESNLGIDHSHGSTAEMGEEPKEQRKGGAEEETGDDGEIKGRVFATMDDVAGKSSQAEGEFPAEVEKGPEEDEDAAEKEEGAADFAEGIHEKILEEMKSRSNELR